MAESFFATLDCELLDRTTFKDPWAAKAAVFDFNEGFYNTKRIHPGLAYHSPVEFNRIRKLSTKKQYYPQVIRFPPAPLSQAPRLSPPTSLNVLATMMMTVHRSGSTSQVHA
ncbi:MAG: IS3 family transposase [Alphaproteobacteria bacterium]|nr:IS3 family transposase [Alphaproteobacteria bacterium]MCB9796534.1 IS3 family transposase [Alphaproteobacteria bacterium]